MVPFIRPTSRLQIDRTQPRAAVLPALRFADLAERLEQHGLIGLSDSHPRIDYREFDTQVQRRYAGRAAAWIPDRIFESYSAFAGELDRIRQQVRDHLSQTHRIGHHPYFTFTFTFVFVFVETDEREANPLLHRDVEVEPRASPSNQWQSSSS